jgi:hypothetical protein
LYLSPTHGKASVTAQELLLDFLRKRLESQALIWLEEKAALLASGATDKSVFTSYSAALRFSGKAALNPETSELAAAAAAATGWNPSDWTCDQAARAFLLLALPPGAHSSKLMDQIYQTADVGEAVALQKALAVLAYPEGHLARARDGIRSNIQQVFEALALRNPYPALHFDEVGWNHMVVKTFFVGVPLHEVWGIDRRVNPDLARMLTDLAYERWAAARDFSPELWRCVGPCADARAREGLAKALSSGDRVAKRAAALALHACPHKDAAMILDRDAALAAVVRNGNLTWENLHHGA